MYRVPQNQCHKTSTTKKKNKISENSEFKFDQKLVNYFEVCEILYFAIKRCCLS